jgi:hypothetical protein
MGEPMTPEDLWDRHGGSLLALARTLLGDTSAAQRAVASALTTLYQEQGEPEAGQALQAAARCVFAHSEAMRSRTSLVAFETTRTSGTSPFRRMALNQRRILALCVYGGHTFRDAAAVMGISDDTAARLISTGLGRGRAV